MTSLFDDSGRVTAEALAALAEGRLTPDERLTVLRATNAEDRAALRDLFGAAIEEYFRDADAESTQAPKPFAGEFGEGT